jgi:acetyl esterase/lipase
MKSFYLLAFSFLLLTYGCKPKVDPMAALRVNSYNATNITYLKTDSFELKCDVYMPGKQLGEPPWIETTNDLKPTVLYIHGGGWQSLDKITRVLDFMPYVNKGWCVVSIDYRFIYQAHFPACIADCRYALNWIYDHSAEYKFDTTKIIVSGESAGGHLSLMTGMLDNDSIISIPNHPIKRKLKVAAIVNWYGVSDMKEIVRTFNNPDFTKNVVGDLSNSEYINKISSPINYVRADLPPVLSIHGTIDSIVPYSHSVVLHQMLDSAKVKNKLITIKGQKHGNFTAEEQSYIFSEIWNFLDEVGI